MSGWFDVIFAPSRFYREIEAERYDPGGALALLLDGELHHYLVLSERAPWPSIEEPRSPVPGYELTAALLLQLAGAAQTEMFELVVDDRDRDPTERALAAALLGALYADSGTLPRAVDLLHDLTVSGSFDGLDLAYLHTHLGLRCIEAGEWERAGRSSSAAQQILRAGRSDRSTRTALRSINLGNEFSLRQIAFGQIDLGLRRQYRRDHLARVDQLTAAGLEHDVERSFKTRFASTRTTSIQFSSEDTAERSLWGALLRSETLGDFQSINRARENLGRYILATAAGFDQRSPDAGFSLLLRGRDDDGLALAARSYVERGPIGAVARIGNEVAQSVWTPLLVAPSLRLITQAADVLDREQVEPLLTRLCTGYEQLLRPTAQSWGAPTVLEAIASVTRVASAQGQTIAAGFVLELATRSSDAFTLQSLRRVVYSIDWSTQPVELVDSWVEFIRSSLGGGGDAAMLAEAAFLSLLSVRHDELVSLARGITPEGVTVAMSALQASSAEDLTSEEASAAAESFLGALRGIRDAAARSSFGFGRTYDPCAEIVSLLLRRPELTYWDEVIAFLTDPKVLRIDKEDALRLLAENLDRLSDDVRLALRRGFAGIRSESSAGFFPEPAHGFESSVVRLGSALGAMTPSAVLQELLVLASSARPAPRVQAARAAAFVEFADNAAGLSIVLLLSRDADADVRAAACRALVSRRWGSHEDGTLVWPRVIELLSEPGREPTLGVLLGLLERVEAGVDVPLAIKSRVGLLAAEHSSWSVRKMAARVSERWR